MDYSIQNPYTTCRRFWKSVAQEECEFSQYLLCDFQIRFITAVINILFRSAKWTFLLGIYTSSVLDVSQIFHRGVWDLNGVAQYTG